MENVILDMVANERWKEFLRDFIKSIETFLEKLDNGSILKQINFNFPVYHGDKLGKKNQLFN